MSHDPPHRSRVLGAPLPGVCLTRTRSGRHFGRHWHDAYGFGVLEDGAHCSASGRGRVCAYAGDVITTNPGEVHDGRPLGGQSRHWCILSVDPAVMASIAGSRGPSAEISRPVIEDPALASVLRRAFGRVEAWHAEPAADAGALAVEESLAESCALLMARHGAVPTHARVPAADVRRVRERLDDCPLEAPTLAELAAAAGLSRYQVLRRFERAYGLPPHAWLLRRRAERARALIRAGATLAAAATSAGFADQSHMTRVFVRQFGFTPGAWRRAVRPQ